MAKKKMTKGKVVAIGVAAVAVISLAVPSEEESEVLDNNDTTVVSDAEVSTAPTILDAVEEYAEVSVEPEIEETPDAIQEVASEQEKEPSSEPTPEPVYTPTPASTTTATPEPTPEPVLEPSVDPEQAFREMLKQYNYVGSKERDKYHYPTCRHTNQINDENLIHFDTEEEAISAGYTACGTCNP